MRIVLALAIAHVSTAAAAPLAKVDSFGANPGALDMYEYVPAGLPGGTPARRRAARLHADRATRWRTPAGTRSPTSISSRCVYPEQQTREQSGRVLQLGGRVRRHREPRARAGREPVDHVDDRLRDRARTASTRTQVYITGFSAGAAFTAVMLATWPDRFAAGAIMEGIPYRCATTRQRRVQLPEPGRDEDRRASGATSCAARTRLHGPVAARADLAGHVATRRSCRRTRPSSSSSGRTCWGTDQTADETETIGQATRTAYKVGGTTVPSRPTRCTAWRHAVSVGAEARRVPGDRRRVLRGPRHVLDAARGASSSG